MRSNAWYGWKPDLPDARDHTFKLAKPRLEPLPDMSDLRGLCPPMFDQGPLGSCIAQAIPAAIQFGQRHQSLIDFAGSRLFLYYNARLSEGTPNEDSGAMIRDGIKSVVDTGICPETDWPYDIGRFTEKPPQAAYDAAQLTQVLQYQRLSGDLTEMLTCLAASTPFVFGFSVYDSFESDAVALSGVLDLPGPGEKLLGGHAVLCVGYDNLDQRFLVRNSWGEDWGMKGYFWMPYAYLTDPNLSDDRWAIQKVEGVSDQPIA